MKHLGLLLLHPGWDASPSQDAQHEVLSLDRMLVYYRVPSMKLLGALLLLPGWDTSPSQGTQHEATKSIITTLLEWNACLSLGEQHETSRGITTLPGWMLVHHGYPT